MKPGCITMTRRQSNNKWSGGIAAHPAPKKIRVQKSARKFLVSIFWDQDGILLTDYLPKGQSINTEYYSSAGVIEGYFEGKTSQEGLQGVLFLHDLAPPRRALATHKKWPTWVSNVLITHPILRVWPRRTTTCSLD